MNKKINLTKLDVSPAYLGLSKQTNKIYFYLKIANKIQEITYLIKDTKNYHQELIAFIKKYSKENKIKIFALGLAGFDDFEEIATKMWQILDIVPRELKIKDKALKIHAQKACRLADSLFDDEIKPINFLDKHGLVKEQFLTNLNEYKKIAEKGIGIKYYKLLKFLKKITYKLLLS